MLDRFETLELTQDLPFGVATPVGAQSWFVYGIDPAPHARTGRRSRAQERRRKKRAKRSIRGCYVGSATRVLNRLVAICAEGSRLRIVGDGHPVYQQAVAQHPLGTEIQLESHPNPKRGPKGSPRSRRPDDAGDESGFDRPAVEVGTSTRPKAVSGPRRASRDLVGSVMDRKRAVGLYVPRPS